MLDIDVKRLSRFPEELVISKPNKESVPLNSQVTTGNVDRFLHTFFAIVGNSLIGGVGQHPSDRKRMPLTASFGRYSLLV